MTNMLTKVTLINRDGDEADIISDPLLNKGYDNIDRRVQALSATREQVRVPFDTLQFVFLKSDGKAVRVYKNLSPEYWEFTDIFFTFDTSISQLHLASPDGATVMIYLGGV